MDAAEEKEKSEEEIEHTQSDYSADPLENEDEEDEESLAQVYFDLRLLFFELLYDYLFTSFCVLA